MKVKQAVARYMWAVVFVASAMLYLWGSYLVEQPYWCAPGTPNPSDVSCVPKSVTSVIVTALAGGAPALIAIGLNRKSLPFLALWSLGLCYWTYVISKAPLFIDGRHGCVLCDDIELLMMMVSWLTFLISAIVWLAIGIRGLLLAAWGMMRPPTTRSQVQADLAQGSPGTKREGLRLRPNEQDRGQA